MPSLRFPLAAAVLAAAVPISHGDIVINEIHYNSEPNTACDEFVEITNSGPDPVNLGGWRFSEGIDFTFPPDTMLAEGDFLVIAENAAEVAGAIGQYSGGLSRDGEDIELTDDTGTVIDRVDYNVESPWPIAANGEGVSMELINPGLDNDLSGSWRSSQVAPTPGAQNSVFAANAPPHTRQIDHDPKQPATGEAATITTKVTDPDGVASVTMEYRIVLPGQYVPALLAKPHGTLLSNPNGPRTPNPAYEQNWVAVPMMDDGVGADAVAGDTVYSATIPGQAGNRTLVRYRIAVEDTLGASVRLPYPDDPSLNFAYFVYDGVPDYVAETRSQAGAVPFTHPKEVMTSLPVYTMLTTQADFDQCVSLNGSTNISRDNLDARSAFNWSCTFVYDGKVYDNIAYRLRQRNARYAGNGKRSFRFRFNDGRHIQLKDFDGNPYPTKWSVINGHRMTGSRGGANFGLYEGANAVLWNLTGTPAPRVHWFHFRVVKGADEHPAGTNGQHLGDFYGLLLAMENYDVRFLEGHDLERGNLYKLKTRGNDGLSIQRYQAKGAVDDASDFTNIINQLRPHQSDQWLRDHVNWDSYYHYHAIVDAIRHYDVSRGITTNNDEHLKNRAYYFQPDASNPLGKLNLGPWDSDTSWGPNWNGGWDWPKNAMANKASFNMEYKNVVREIRDLVWQEDQIGLLLDKFYGQMRDFQRADRDRWTGAQGSPSPGFQTDGPMLDRIEEMKDFAFVGGSWDGGNSTNRDWVYNASGALVANDSISRDSGVSGQQGRDAYLDQLAFDPRIPDKPTITYTGAAGFPVNGLAFQSSAFADPQGAGTFAAMEWRVSEVLAYEPLGSRPPNEVFFPFGSVWKYNDTGADLLGSDIVVGHPNYDATNWKHPDFDDSGWGSGPGQLGYGNGPQTLLDRGPSNDRHVTFYFRRTFSIPDASIYEGLEIQLSRDDGAIIYVNGHEADQRSQMPSGVVGHDTLASGSAGESAIHLLTVSGAALVDGVNTIAIEVHNERTGSSDIHMDLQLEGVFPEPLPYTGDLKFEWDADWESGELAAFDANVAIPTSATREGRTYRTRVRHKDDTGRWSNWSDPVEFAASVPDLSLYTDHLVISEIMYHPADATPAEDLLGYANSDFEWIEIQNVSDTETVDLTDLRFTKGVDFDIPAGTMLPPGQFALVVRNEAAFESRHGPGLPVIGEYLSDKLNNGGEQLKLSFGAGAGVRDFDYDDEPPWPTGAQGSGKSIVLMAPETLPDHGNGSNWRASTASGGSPGEATPVIGFAAWIAGFFDPKSPEAAPDADPDMDGFASFLEFALGTSPNDPSSVPRMRALVVSDAGAEYLAVEYVERTDGGGLAFVPEVSTDLASWLDDTAETVLVSSTDNGDGTRTVVRRDATPSQPGVGRHLRIRVTGG